MDDLVSTSLIQQSIKKLTEKLETLNQQNTKLQKRLLWLTIVTTALVLIQTIIFLSQIIK